MRSVVWLMCLASGASALGGCVRHYREPAIGEPHATVRVRIVRHARLGPMLEESVQLGEDTIRMPPEGPHPSIRAVRVRPGPTRWTFRTMFFHTEQRMRREAYQESYRCGSTTSHSHGTYSSQARTCYRTLYRDVYDTVRVPDAQCSSLLPHAPLDGAAYLIQFDFMGQDQCTTQCFRQLPQPGGRFRLVRCGPDEPPVGSRVTTTGAAAWRGATRPRPRPRRTIRRSGSLGLDAP